MPDPKEKVAETTATETTAKTSTATFDLDTFKKGSYSLDELKSFAEDKTNPLRAVLLTTISSIEKRLAKASTKLGLPEAQLTKETILLEARFVLLERAGKDETEYRQDLYLENGKEKIHILLLGKQTCAGSGRGRFTGKIFWREGGQEFRGLKTTVSQWVLGSVERDSTNPDFIKGMSPEYQEL